MDLHDYLENSYRSLENPPCGDLYESFQDTASTINPALLPPSGQLGQPPCSGSFDQDAFVQDAFVQDAFVQDAFGQDEEVLSFGMPLTSGSTAADSIPALPKPSMSPSTGTLADQFVKHCRHFLRKHVPISAASIGSPSRLNYSKGEASLKLRLSSTIQDRSSRKSSNRSSRDTSHQERDDLTAFVEFCSHIIRENILPDRTTCAVTMCELNNVRLDICVSPWHVEAGLAHASETGVPQPALSRESSHLSCQPPPSSGLPQAEATSDALSQVQPHAASLPSAHDSHEIPRYSQKEWSQMMPTIACLYKEHTVKEMVPILGDRYDFHVSESKLKKRLAAHQCYKPRPKTNSR